MFSTCQSWFRPAQWTATKVYVAGASGNASYRLIFGETNDTTSTNKSLFQDTGNSLNYNPSTNTLTCTNFSGNGSQLGSLNASNISSGTINAARVPTLNQNTTGSSGSCTGNAASSTTSYVTATGSNVDYRMVFTNADENSGNKSF